MSEKKDSRVGYTYNAIWFFSSVIKSGGIWSRHCQSSFDSATAALESVNMELARKDDELATLKGIIVSNDKEIAELKRIIAEQELDMDAMAKSLEDAQRLLG